MNTLEKIHNVMKSSYRACAPAWLRGSKLANILKSILYKCLPANIIYDHDFLYHVIDQPATSAAPVIACSVVRDLAPKCVLDVGCGSGAMLSAFRDLGVIVKGFEFADPALELCRERGIDVLKVDLRDPDNTSYQNKVDVVLSLEVAEHLPAKCAAGYVNLLCSSAPVVIFSAAPPGQGGTDHLNEQPMEYWINLFTLNKCVPEWKLTDKWRTEWSGSGRVAKWYTNNLIVFRSQCNSSCGKRPAVLRAVVERSYILACAEDTGALERSLSVERFSVKVVRSFYREDQMGWSRAAKCLWGHRTIWQEIVDTGVKCALICEADFVPCVGIGALPLPFHVDDAEDALGYLYAGGVSAYDIHHRQYVRGHSSCTVAYMLSASVARRLIQFADECFCDHGGKYVPWDCVLGHRVTKVGVKCWMPYRQYGEHGGTPNLEHAVRGMNPSHQSDTLYGPLHFLPLYAKGSRIRYSIIRIKARLWGIARLLFLRYLLPCECRRARQNGTLLALLRFSIGRHLYFGGISLTKPPLPIQTPAHRSESRLMM